MSMKKGKKILTPNLQYYQFDQDDWKKRIFFRENKLNYCCNY